MRVLHRFSGYLFAAGLLIAAPACAPAHRVDRHRDYRVDSQRRAYTTGYDEGLDSGRSDVGKGRRFEYEQHGEFRHADKGYGRHDGDRHQYRETFRRGFVAGYSAAYRATERDADRGGPRRR